jgi:hypothetical protein
VKVETAGAHEATHRALVDRITHELKPVRRLWPIPVRLAIWMLVDIAVLAILWNWNMRPDFAVVLRKPQFLLEMGLFFGAGQLLAFFALRAAVPGRETSRAQVWLCATMVAGAILLVASEPVAAYGSEAEFVRAGVRCMCASIIFATLPLMTLFWVVRRGAVFAAKRTGALVGGAALLFTFAIQRGGCPLDDRQHLLVWHLIAPGTILIAISVIAAARWMRLSSRI